MKTSNAVKLSLVVVAVAFVSTITGYIFGARANSGTEKQPVKREAAAEIVSNEEKKVDKAPETISVTQSYLLRETDGYLVLYRKYSDGRETVYRNYDILVKSLPQADRESLEKGIEVDSLSEALQLVEDYS